MGNILITDQSENNFLAVNLIDILNLIKPLVIASHWNIYNLECFGSKADELQELADCNIKVPGKLLIELADDIIQVIEGIFVGQYSARETPWIIIRAVDGFAYEIECEDEKVIRKIRQRFQNVTDISPVEPVKLNL